LRCAAWAWRRLERKAALGKKRPAEAGRLCLYVGLFQLRIGVARLLVRLLGIFVTLGGSVALLAGFLTAALLLAGLLIRRLILLAGLVLVRHVISFHGNAGTTAPSPASFRQKKNDSSRCLHDVIASLPHSAHPSFFRCGELRLP
jgi:hypothetical protein